MTLNATKFVKIIVPTEGSHLLSFYIQRYQNSNKFITFPYLPDVCGILYLHVDLNLQNYFVNSLWN